MKKFKDIGSLFYFVILSHQATAFNTSEQTNFRYSEPGNRARNPSRFEIVT